MLEKREQSNFSVYCTAIAINVFSFASGVAYSWTSPAIPQLVKSIGLTTPEQSWVASLLSLGSAMGPLVFGQLSRKIGYKNSLVIGAVPLAASYVILAYADEAYLLYIGRLVGGFGTGAGFTLIASYVGEIADDKNRGALGCFMAFILSIGLLFSYSVGPFIELKTFCFINIIPPVLFIILAVFYIRESPYFFLAKKDFERTESTIKHLRGTDDPLVVENEIVEIQKNLKSLQNELKFSSLFEDRALKKAIVLSAGTMFFQQFSGITPVLSYMQSIFDEANTALSPELSVILVGIIVCIASGSTSFLVDTLGRKIFLLCSCTLAGVSQLTLGIFFCLKQRHYDVESVSWLPVLCLVLFMVAYYIGLGIIPWVLLGELFPSNAKAVASSIAAFVCLICAFLVTVLYPYMSESIGTGESFVIFAMFCALGFVFVYVCLPETKGRSLYDIQILLSQT